MLPCHQSTGSSNVICLYLLWRNKISDTGTQGILWKYQELRWQDTLWEINSVKLRWSIVYLLFATHTPETRYYLQHYYIPLSRPQIVLNMEKIFLRRKISLCAMQNSYSLQIWLGTKSCYSAFNISLEAYCSISVHGLLTITSQPFTAKHYHFFVTWYHVKREKIFLNMSLYQNCWKHKPCKSLLLVSLQITAVREGTILLIKRRIRPNMIDIKTFRPFLCKGMVWELKFSRQKTGMCRRHQRLWDNATDYKQVWTT